MKNIRVRFAPSPTGPLHIGAIRTAIYNYIFAKKYRGKFILRIEDTDKDRFVIGTENDIVNALEWCGLSIDESPFNEGKYKPYKQSDRKHLYDFYLQKLFDKEHAYYAYYSYYSYDSFYPLDTEIKKKDSLLTYNAKRRLQMNHSLDRDTKNLLDRLKLPYVIRFKTPKDKLISIYDEIRGEIKINTSSLDDKILVKSDGMATYHFANVVDDHLMKITHVIRGEEWLSSMPLHILIYETFEWEIPVYVHLPLLLKTSGSGKLSKRDGDRQVFSIKCKETKNISYGYGEEGYFPEAIVMILGLLGWNTIIEKELFCLKKLEHKFTLKRIHKSGAIFNQEKAYCLNQQSFQRKSINHLMIIYRKVLNKHGAYTNDKNLFKIIKTVQNRVSFVQELWDNAYYFFIAPQTYDNQYTSIDSFSILKNIQKSLMKEEDFRSSNLKRIIKFFIYDNQFGLKTVFQTLRLSLLGFLKGGDIFFIMEILGKKETIERIRKYY